MNNRTPSYDHASNQFLTLNIIALNGDPLLHDIFALEQDAAVDLVRYLDPPGEQVTKLTSIGYSFKPTSVLYKHELQGTARAVHEASYVNSLSSRKRGAYRQADRRLAQLTSEGTVQVIVDQAICPNSRAEFIQMQSHYLAGKHHLARQILAERVKGVVSIETSYSEFPLGIYLKQGQSIVAGLLSREMPDGPSIAFCAVDTTFKKIVPNVQLWLLVHLIKIWPGKHVRAVYYGMDTNLYGYHLDVGLLEHKMSLGFHPTSAGQNELLKIVNYSKLNDPVAFFERSPSDSLRLIVVTSESDSPVLIRWRSVSFEIEP